MLADLVGGDHEGLVLDRACAKKDFPVIARRRDGERGGDRDDARAPHGEDAVELGEADVVTDREAELDAGGRVREHDLIARVLDVGLAVGVSADFDVEHVDLAVDSAQLTAGIHVHARVRELLVSGQALGEGAGDEVDSELARDRARPREGLALERLGGGEELRVGPDSSPLLGQHDHARAVRRGRAREALGLRAVRRGVRARVQLHRRDPHLQSSLGSPGALARVARVPRRLRQHSR
jgi:hypothetical protein